MPMRNDQCNVSPSLCSMRVPVPKLDIKSQTLQKTVPSLHRTANLEQLV
jgi:hypothetical protein